MATFVLVHGAWHGGWCWKKVTPLLRAAGHEVCTPTLTGLGERVHLAAPAVGLTTHVQDVANVLEYEDLSGVLLVGHSYGGMVITGVADRAAQRLAHLVYLDAFVPADGQAQVDLMPAATTARFEESSRAGGEGWRIPLNADGPMFGVTDGADLGWMRTRLGPHPLRAFQEPVRLANVAAQVLPRTYIYCAQPGEQPGSSVFAPFAERARTERGWRYRELPTGHDAMVTMPRELADLLQEVAEERGR